MADDPRLRIEADSPEVAKHLMAHHRAGAAALDGKSGQPDIGKHLAAFEAAPTGISAVAAPPASLGLHGVRQGGPAARSEQPTEQASPHPALTQRRRPRGARGTPPRARPYRRPPGTAGAARYHGAGL